jgi:hypothetical protein
MSDRRRSKLEVLVAVIGIAAVLGGVLVASTSRSEAIVALEYLVLCHFQTQTGEYSQVLSPGAVSGHIKHKEDLVLAPTSVCPQK